MQKAASASSQNARWLSARTNQTTEQDDGDRERDVDDMARREA